MTNAAQFNGTGERLTRSTGPSPNAAYTVAFWSRVDSYKSADYQTLFTYLMSGSEWETIMLDSSNRLVIEAGVSGSGSRVNAASAFGTGTWKYVALVRASTTSLKAYVDGTEVLSLTTNISARSAAVTEFAFGSDTYTEDSNSSVAYARAWSAALNTTELAAEKVSATAVRTTDLWGDWPMQANGNDSSGNSRTLTAVGTVSYVTDGPTLPLGASVSDTVTISEAVTVQVQSTGGTTLSVSKSETVTLSETVTARLATLSISKSETVTLSETATARLASALSVSKSETVTLSEAKTVLLIGGVCIGGVLEVDSGNPRYFSVGGNIKVLAGFHTWMTVVDHGVTYPPAAFDYLAMFDAAVAKGANFIKLWAAWESLQDWCDAEFYLYPPAYERTGPGNAADGRLKVDLTQPNAELLGRIRTRAIEAGNRGLYACVQLFDGWQVTQKGYSVGTPGVYHPYNAANNINSIDGDIDNDGQAGETRDSGWTAVFNLQKGFVAAVIDAVNDLDNIIYEISNEEDTADETTAGDTVAWQHALIDYIHTYEAGKPKQHPVGMTVLFPSGSDSDLFSSNAEWISPKDGSVVTSVTASNGSKVILWDTDHTVGLTDEHEWVWLAFTRGCSPLYMDEWDGGFYGTDKRATAANEKIRANLGYILDYAALLDLANVTPQGSLSNTGYALAKTTGSKHQYLAYQPTSGDITLDLSSTAGVLTVEWLRPSTGGTGGGTTVAGGASRSLTNPWPAEDAVVYLWQSTYAKSVSDTVTLSEAVTVSVSVLSTRTVSAADAVALSEVVTVSVQAATARSVSVADAVTLSETVTVSIQSVTVRAASVVDAVTLSETAAVALSAALAVSVAESVALSEATTITLPVAGVLYASVADAVTLAEAAVLSLSAARISTADTLTLSEAVTVAIQAAGQMVASATDAVTLSETVTTALQLTGISAGDTVTLSEAVAVTIQVAGLLQVNVIDNLTLTDAPAAGLALPGVSVADGVTLGESVALAIGYIVPLAIDVSESLGITESLGYAMALPGVSVVDTVTVADIITAYMLGVAHADWTLSDVAVWGWTLADQAVYTWAFSDRSQS
jgi:hypothetical protein